MKLRFDKFKSNPLKAILYLGVIFSMFLYVFSIPTFGENTGFLRYIIYISLFLMTCFTFIYCFLYKKIKFPKLMLLVLGFVVFAFIGTAYYSKDYRGWISLVLLCISFYSLYLSFTIFKNKYFIISIISMAFGLFGLVFICYFRNEFIHFSSIISAKSRLGPPFDNANGVAAYAVVGLATSLYLVLFWKKKIRYLFILPFLISCLVGISTGSRSFLIIAVLFVLLFLYFALKKHKLIYLIALAITIVLFIVLLNLPFMQVIKDRIVAAFKTLLGIADKVDSSTLARENYIAYGFYLGSKNMLFGYGVGGFGLKSGLSTYSHSNFAEIICNFGIVGLILFYVPLIILLVKCFADRRVDKTFIISFVVYYIVVSFTNVLYYKKIYYLVLAFMFYISFYLPSLTTKRCKKQLTVCFAVDSMGPGGAERVVSTIANELSKVGHKVNILIVASPNEDSFYQLDNSINVISIVKKYDKKVNPLKRILLLRSYYKNTKPDMVISFLKNVCIYNWIATNSFDFVTVVSERNNPNSYTKFEQFLLRRAFYASDKCVFQTNDAMGWYGEEIKTKSVIIYNPVNLNVDGIIKKEQRDRSIVYVGRLEEQKNVFFLIDVFEKFSINNNYILKIYGDGSLKEQIVKYIKNKNMDNKVLLMGNSTDWQNKEVNAGCFLLTSKFEGMPNALEEAACLGIPCVSSNCKIGGPFELSKILPNITLVDRFDVDLFCDAINESISKTNYDIDYNELTPANISQKWIKLYE